MTSAALTWTYMSTVNGQEWVKVGIRAIKNATTAGMIQRYLFILLSDK
jgi:hypothetical protein